MKFGEIWTGTPVERKALEDQRQVDARKGKGKKMTPRHALLDSQSLPLVRGLHLRRGLIVGGLSLAVIATLITPAGQSIIDPDGSTVRNQAAQMGLNYNSRERQLWESAPFKSDHIAAVENTPSYVLRDLQPRADWNLSYVETSMMPRSQNPLIQEAARFMQDRRSVYGDLVVEHRDGSVMGINKYSMGFDFKVIDGRMVWYITPTYQLTLSSRPEDLALQLVHETKHIRRLISIVNELPKGMNAHQIEGRLRSEMRGRWNELEAEAYGEQYKAYIFHRGLTGSTINRYDEFAAKLVRCGLDVRSSCWQDKVRRDFIRS